MVFTEDNKEHNMHFSLDYLHLHEERTTNKSGETLEYFKLTMEMT